MPATETVVDSTNGASFQSDNISLPETPFDKLGEFFLRHGRLTSLLVLAVIAGVELINFGAPYKRTGFYLDDWLMLRHLSFGPQGYLDMLSAYLVNDPRVIIRPLEALHFGTVYFFSGADPSGWRLSNMVMEIASAFFGFLIVARLANSRLLGLTAALFFVTFPIHDSTHYWAVCSCVTISLLFYLTSLWATLKATAGNKGLFLTLAYASFALSIYGYEPFLPLCALNVVAYVVLQQGWKPSKAAFTSMFVHSLPYAGIVGSLLVYQRWIVPSITKAALHGIHLNPGLIVKTIFDGMMVTSPVSTIPFIAKQVSNFASNDGFNGSAILRLALLAILLGVGLTITGARTRISAPSCRLLVVLGLLTTALSYSIFGLNPEYAPTLDTIVNRINTGAALGLSMVFAGFIGWSCSAQQTLFSRRNLAVGLTFAILLGVFAIANWSLAKPWEISWAVQERTFRAFKERKNEFVNRKNVMLINCPRYVNCSPVFDGVWDFECMLTQALGRTDIKGGVVSERMRIGEQSVQDVSLGYVCGEYPFKDLVLVTPGLQSVFVVNNAREFIDVVEKNGMGFGLLPSAVEGWKQQAASGTRRHKNGTFVPLVSDDKHAQGQF